MFLKQSTAYTDRIGPFLDKGDGVTEEVGLTTANSAIFLSKAGGDYGAKTEATALSHDQDGWYIILYDATDTNTVGELKVMIQAPATHLPVWKTYWVLEEAIYDALFAASAAGFDANQRVDVGKWLGTAVGANTAGIPTVDIVRITNATNPANTLSAWLQTSVNGIADSGTTTTMVDAALSQADDAWNGAMLLFKTGTNSGYSAVVTDFDAASDTITFAPSVPNAVTTENYTLIKGLGWSDVQAVGGTVQTAGDLAALIVTADAAVDVAVADLANATDGLGALKTLIDTVNSDLANGTDGLGALKALIDTVNSDLANGTDGLGALKTLIDAIPTTAMRGTDGANTTKTGYALASDGLDNVVVETGVNARQALAIISAALAGVLSGAATATITIKALKNDGTTRISATVDSDGNRSAITATLPA